MLNGSENAVTGLLAHLFATEGVEMPHPEPSSHRSEKSPEVLAAWTKAKAAVKTPAFGVAFAELMDTEGADGQTPTETIQKLVNKRLRSQPLGGADASDRDDVVQDVTIKIMTHLSGSKSDFDPAKATFNGWVTQIAITKAIDFLRPDAGGDKVGGLGGDGAALDVARDRRNEPVHDPMAHMHEFTADEQKYCDFLKSYLTKVMDGHIAFPHELKVKKSRDPEYTGADVLPPELKVKRLVALGIARVFAFMAHYGLGAPKLKHDDLVQQLASGYGIHKVTPQAMEQWFKTLWPMLENEFALVASSLGIDNSKEQLDQLMRSFRGKLTHRILVGGEAHYGKVFCEGGLSNDFSDLLSVLESWHATANR